MTKVKSLADLKAMREKLQSNLDVREKAEHPESLVQIKVAMATCGIAAGAKQVMEHMMAKAEELKVAAVFTQTGCMGYCHAEPTKNRKRGCRLHPCPAEVCTGSLKPCIPHHLQKLIHCRRRDLQRLAYRMVVIEKAGVRFIMEHRKRLFHLPLRAKLH